LLRVKLMLQGAAERRYAELPIPCDEDALAEEFIREWRAGSSGSPEADESLDRLVRGMLLTFAIRAASRAVRQHDPQHLRQGLAAVCIAGTESDSKDLQQVACALYDGCSRLGVDPSVEFREAAGQARGGAARILSEFGSLPPGEATPPRFRVQESTDEGGFRYFAR
jgi:hypothetical protein